MPKAKPSTRSSGKVTLTMGLVNIPLDLYTGTVSDSGVTRKEYLPESDGDHPVGRGLTDKVTGDLIPPERLGDVVRKVETEFGPVFVEDGEIEKLFTLLPNTLAVKKFLPAHHMHRGQYVPKGVMFAEPTKTGSGRKKGPDPLASKLLATLLKSMSDNNAMAVCELTTRGIPKPCVLMPDGRLWLIFHTDATREQHEGVEVDLAQPEVDMMSMLMKQMWSDDVIEVNDERSALIQGFADEKAEAGDFDKPEVVAAADAPAATTDLMALLQASVDAAKTA